MNFGERVGLYPAGKSSRRIVSFEALVAMLTSLSEILTVASFLGMGSGVVS
jgi:hypothetical protein